MVTFRSAVWYLFLLALTCLVYCTDAEVEHHPLVPIHSTSLRILERVWFLASHASQVLACAPTVPHTAVPSGVIAAVTEVAAVQAISAAAAKIAALTMPIVASRILCESRQSGKVLP
ncbi:hypothetical protein BU17DRAFT_64309 [Hysterangium stoloniferum]|nr:hypothetical protein BU17DRAFT_64309 [Hysterangium stoloniferum]